MSGWRRNGLMDRLGIDIPIIQAPMAGSDSPTMTIAVSKVGALGSLACATLSAEAINVAVGDILEATDKPFNLNFFCHKPPVDDPKRESRWRQALLPYFEELGLDPEAHVPFVNRVPFDEALCGVIEAIHPPVVSFHFGLPGADLLARVKAAGAIVLSSATTVAEAIWLEQNGCDAVIAQGFEAGGHRGLFLGEDVTTQIGTLALVPQIVDAINLPVIAAGGIGDSRGIAAALMLGASAVQMGSAYLFCPEARVSQIYAGGLHNSQDRTAVTNLFTGRPARGIINRLMSDLGPMSHLPPDFPLAGQALAALRAHDQATGSADFTNLWAGQAAPLGRVLPAGELTRSLSDDALLRLKSAHNDLAF